MEGMVPMKVLITGANGFVGANLTRVLVSKGFEVVTLIRPGKEPWRLLDLGERIRVAYGDITDVNGIRKVLSEHRPDGIINTAIYGGYHYQKDEDNIYRTNLDGTRILLDESIKFGFKWFINTGSSSEYGEKGVPMSESDYAEPIDSYGISKLASSLYCKAKAKQFSLPIFTLRLFSIYGYLEEPHRLIPYLMTSKIKEKTAQLNSPDSVRDFTFIEDVSEAYLKTIENSQKLPSGEILNIGTGESTRISEVVQSFSEVLEQELPVAWSRQQGRISDNFSKWAADISKAKNLLSWEPKNNLKSGLAKTYKWFVKNWTEMERWYSE